MPDSLDATVSRRPNSGRLRASAAAAVSSAMLLGGLYAFLPGSDASANSGRDSSSGTLTIVSVSNPTWTLLGSPSDAPATGKVIDPSSFTISPGDVLQYDAVLAVDAGGPELAAELTLDPTSYTLDPTLASLVTIDFHSQPVIGRQEIPVTVKICFSDAISQQPAAGSVSLGGLSFALSQAPSAR